MKFCIDQDYHIHSNLSSCSTDPEQTPDRILEYARTEGLKEICITDHFWDEMVPGASNWYRPQNYHHVSSSLPLPQDDHIAFFFGCETELDKNMTVGISDQMMDRFDFIIIPTTHLHMRGFTIDENDTSVERRADVYVNRLDRLLNMDLPFEKIGIAHLTCELISYHFSTDWDEHIRIIDAIQTETFRELFGRMAEKGVGFELNLPFDRYSKEESERILRPYRIAKEVGCKFYFGSDAHDTEALRHAKQNFEAIASALELDETDRFRIKK